MKKIIAFTLIVAAFYACGNSDGGAKDGGKKDTAAAPSNDISQNEDYKKGLALIATSDCLTCHKVEEASTGPAYRDVANKYSNDQTTLDTLSHKIIKGGKGNWGPVAMTPHPTLSEADAKQMVKYIMLLKNN